MINSLYKNKYLKYKNKYINLKIGGAAAVDKGSELVKKAIEWYDKGNYANCDYYFYVDPLYGTVINYFIILFADFDNIFEGNLIGIKNLALQKYADKTLSFNCWQFILLCMMECGLIDTEIIKNLYKIYTNNPVKRIPLYFMKDYKETESEVIPYNIETVSLGDIILFKNTEGIIYHTGIYCGNNNCIQIFFYPVMIKPIKNDNVYYMKYQTVVDNIKNNIRNEFMIKSIKNIKYGIIKEYKKEIDAKLNEKLQGSGLLNMSLEDKMTYLTEKNKQSLEFGAPVDILVKQQYFELNRTAVEDYILAYHNIIF